MPPDEFMQNDDARSHRLAQSRIDNRDEDSDIDIDQDEFESTTWRRFKERALSRIYNRDEDSDIDMDIDIDDEDELAMRPLAQSSMDNRDEDSDIDIDQDESELAMGRWLLERALSRIDNGDEDSDIDRALSRIDNRDEDSDIDIDEEDKKSKVKILSKVASVGESQGILLSCSICLEEYSDKDRVRFLDKCGHYFHVQCIDKWLYRNNSCPICRTSPS